MRVSFELSDVSFSISPFVSYLYLSCFIDFCMHRVLQILPTIIRSSHKAWTSYVSQTEGLLFQINGSLAIITLDRPKVLNSLSLESIRSFTKLLIACDDDPNIRVILVKGNGGKAFCSGGDIVGITNSARKGGDIHLRFFQEEYCLSKFIISPILVFTFFRLVHLRFVLMFYTTSLLG